MMNDRTSATDSFDNLRTLLAATTPGEWEVDRNTPFSLDLVGIFAPEAGGYVIKVKSDPFDEEVNRDEDAAFIVAAHNELPALLARLDEVTAVIEKAPHDSGCDIDWGDVCDCWKSVAPSSVLAAHDAKVRAEALREAADEVRPVGALSSSEVREWLRARADKEENR